jgi:hypothetical protein
MPVGGTFPLTVRAVRGALASLLCAGLITACGGGNPATDGPRTDTPRADTVTGDVPGDPTTTPDGGDGGGLRACQGAECAAPTIDCTGNGNGNMAVGGKVTAANASAELLKGPAAQGMVGDYFMRNDRIRVIVQGPNRAIGPAPYGGNIIDADFLNGDGFDQFGEMSLVLQFGRTVNFNRDPRVLCDGSAGGPVVIQFSGQDQPNDFINLPGLLYGAIQSYPDPNQSLDLDVAATYVLKPGATAVEVYWTFLNTGNKILKTSFGTITDTGGEVGVFAPTFGYKQVALGIELFTDSTAVDYVAFTAPGPDPGTARAYGLYPRFDAGGPPHEQFVVAGVHAMIFQTKDLLEVINSPHPALVVDAGQSVTHQVDFIVANDPAGVTAEVLARSGADSGGVSGKVTVAGQPRGNVRVGALNADGTVATVFDTAADGTFAGMLPPGEYDLQADLDGHLRPAALHVTIASGQAVTGQAIDIPAPATLEYMVVDEADGQPIPAKISIVGIDPTPPDNRFRDSDKEHLPNGLTRIVSSPTGSSAADGPVSIEPNEGTNQYRVIVTHGPEYTRYEQLLAPLAAGSNTMIQATLKRAVDTTGYVAGDFHQHTLNSPDSPVPLKDRVIGYLVEGAEFVATSDHEYVTDLQPIIDEMNAQDRLNTMPGVEVTSWDYGHFNVYPVTPDPSVVNRGAIDWGQGDTLTNLSPSEIFDMYTMTKGAKVRQVNHPRAVPVTGLSENIVNFQATWDRAGLVYDFTNKVYGGTAETQPVPNDVLRLGAGKEIFTRNMDAFEVYNGFRPADTDGDGVREEQLVDRILRDYMNLLAFGAVYTPMGTSDTHTRGKDPSGLARTMVRVPDDSRGAIMAGLVDTVTATLNGSSNTPRDVVVTNTPFVKLDVLPDDGSCNLPAAGTDMCTGQSCTRQGSTLALNAGTSGAANVRYQVTVETPIWAQVDTVELFINQTFDGQPAPQTDSALTPTVCFTTLSSPAAKCTTPLTPFVTTNETTQTMIATGCIDLRSLPKRTGAVGDDSYIVARTSGQGSIFPLVPNAIGDAVDANDLAVNGVPAGQGVMPYAFTSAVLVDVDGGGWRGPFQPQ